MELCELPDHLLIVGHKVAHGTFMGKLTSYLALEKVRTKLEDKMDFRMVRCEDE